MQQRQGKIIRAILVTVLLAWQTGTAAAAEFSAVIVTRNGDEKRQSKIFIKGDKMRREFANPGGSTIFIVPGDKNIMWMLEPEVRTFKELPFDKDALPKALNLGAAGSGSKQVGTEKLKGYDTDKYETMVRTPSGYRQGTVWIAQKLGVPLRIETADKSFIQVYKDIKEGGVDDALFALPPGYRQKDMSPAPPKNK